MAKHRFITTSTVSNPIIIATVILLITILTFYTLHQHNNNSNPKSDPIDYTHYHSLFLSSATNSTLADYLRHLTLRPHLAGTPQSHQTASYVLSHFQRLNLHTQTSNHTVLLSYPKQASLTARFRNNSVKDLNLMENLGFKSDVGGGDGVVMPYHAYSPSGTVYGEAMYVNFGREKDYDRLENMKVNVSGCVVVVRRGLGLSRGGVTEIARGRGAVGVVMFTEEGLEDGVERGKVMVGGLGDPLSPGWGAVEGGERMKMEDEEVVGRFPKIVSLPISRRVAEEVLGLLGGHRVPEEWVGKVKVKGFSVGPGPVKLNLTYQGEKKMATIQNVFATIKGSEESDRYILMGNHRDAWTYGAVDPNSGTAALLDIARRYALLMHRGWRPRRTIILCSWDAEEFGMIGSTEWVEQNHLSLRSKVVAYLNVDCAVQGSGFFVAASPQLDDIIIEVMKKVQDPESEHLTLYEKWKSADEGAKIYRLTGAASDFAPFMHHAGIPSVDLFYGQVAPVYHTAYDSYEWMMKNGDPHFKRHVAVAGIWGLLALSLADESVIPFNYSSYAEALQEHSNLIITDVSLEPLHASIKELASTSDEINLEAKEVSRKKAVDVLLALKRRMLNDRLMLAERGFMDTEALLERQWFKHLIYGPPSNCENKQEYFPRIADVLFRSANLSKSQRQATIEHEIWRVARAVQRVASFLKGEPI